MQKIHFNRVLYGHDGTQYRILSATNPELVNQVENLCKRVGTPDGNAVLPFLMSVPLENHLFMILGQTGPSDNQGRETLYFQALIADISECNQYSVNAFTFWERGCFDDTNTNMLEFEPDIHSSEHLKRIPFEWSGDSLAIIAQQQTIPWFRAFLGVKANRVAWSTFSFRVLQSPFKVYGLSEYAERPAEIPCVDQYGNTLQIPEVYSETNPTIQTRHHRRFPWLLLLVGLLIVSLMINFYTISGSSKSQPPKPPFCEVSVSQETPVVQDDSKAQIESLRQEVVRLNGEIEKRDKQIQTLSNTSNETCSECIKLNAQIIKLQEEFATRMTLEDAKEKVLKELQEHIPKEQRIKNREIPGNEEAEPVLPVLRKNYFTNIEGADKEFVTKIRVYIDFVNTYILKERN